MTGYEQSPDYGGPDPTWLMALGKPFLILVIIAALFLGYRSSAKAELLTPEQYHAQFGPCACPGDKSKIGVCGHLSGYCRCGGHEPLCFAGDEDKAQRERNRQSHCRYGCVPNGQ
jgi:hypothetical protein